MTEKKTTQRDALTYVLEHCEIPEHIEEKLTAMLAQIEKKAASGSKSQTATQKVNAELATAMLASMESGKEYTVTELMKVVPAFAEYVDDKGNGISNQKASSIVSGQAKVGTVERISKKGRSYFVKVEG